MDALRKWFNIIEALFDRQAPDEAQHVSRVGESVGTPLTAAESFALCRPVSLQLDRDAQLKRIVSPDGAIQRNGAATRWEFFFDLPRRRAKLRCEWSLLIDESSGDFSQTRVDLVVTPFPPPDGPVRQLVKDGKLLRRQMVGLWREEMSRTAPLPPSFRDSTDALESAIAEGINPDQTELTISATCAPGQAPEWIVQSRNHEHRLAFL